MPPVGAAMIHTNRQTDRQTDGNETNRCFSQLRKRNETQYQREIWVSQGGVDKEAVFYDITPRYLVSRYGILGGNFYLQKYNKPSTNKIILLFIIWSATCFGHYCHKQAVYKNKKPTLIQVWVIEMSHTNSVFLISGLRNKMYTITCSWVFKNTYNFIDLGLGLWRFSFSSVARRNHSHL
jgi:hypothetical protein